MKRCVLSVLAVVSLLTVPVPIRAQTPLDFYKMGQFLEWTAFFNNLASIPKKSDLRAKLDVERQALVKLGAPAAVLTGYDHMVNAVVTLPFDTAYSSWTATQQSQFTGSGVDWNAIRTWFGTADTQPRFYFWLGSDTEYVVKDGPASVNSWGQTLDSQQASYKAILSDYAIFPTTDVASYKTAVPGIQAAITALGAYNGKTLAAADITAIQQAAQPIYDAANGKVAQ